METNTEVFEPMKILGIPGSLRKLSFNKAALKVAVEVAPKNVDIEIFERLGEFPLFNQDEENHPPPIVLEFKDKIRQADAILFSSPEYNYSIPGVLKNAIDWASRPYGDSAWEGKPVGIMSAAGGNIGGARGQYHLRQVFVFLDMHPLNRPEVIISKVHDKVDMNNKIVDSHTREKIAELINELVRWTLELQTGSELLDQIE